MVLTIQKPTLTFVIIFILLSWMFLSNTFKLWFKPDLYYAEMRESLTRMPVPFRNFFIARLENRERWEPQQKVFSLIGVFAVLVADVMVVMAWLA